MKIGILSDTHISKNIDGFIISLKEHFHDVDLIIHGGDFIERDLVMALKSYKRFAGVYGNVDSEGVKELLNRKEIIQLGGYSIGVYHGNGKGKTTIDRAYDQFKNAKVDIIIFGHSHQPIVKTYKNVLMINPGSLTNKRKERWFSYVILELYEDSIDVSLQLLAFK